MNHARSLARRVSVIPLVWARSHASSPLAKSIGWMFERRGSKWAFDRYRHLRERMEQSNDLEPLPLRNLLGLVRTTESGEARKFPDEVSLLHSVDIPELRHVCIDGW